MRFAFACFCAALAFVAVDATPVPEPRLKGGLYLSYNMVPLLIHLTHHLGYSAANIHSRVDAQILSPPPVTRAFNDGENLMRQPLSYRAKLC